jgi:glucose-6-phosphate dehydrogenase assembly protein OpcA
MNGPYVPTGSTVTPLEKVERELAQQLKTLQGPGEMPVQIARMSNLIVFCDDRTVADAISAQLPEIVSCHPARVLLLCGEPTGAIPLITASVLVRPLGSGPHHSAFCEQVSLHAAGDGVGRLAFAVRTLLVGDLPTNLWWASNVPPPMAGTLLHDLGEHVQQIVYDSLGWREPAKGVAATASWLKQVEMTMPGGRWRVASDLNWRRLKYWRRLLAQTFESKMGTVDSATELLVEHGPHAVIEAWELVSWLTRRLGWQVQGGKVQSGVEIDWQFRKPTGPVTIRVRRLPDGPSEVRRVRLQCKIDDQPGAVVIRAVESRSLVVEQEGPPAPPRILMVQPQSPTDLIARQLSDRDRDPVFSESMAVAQTLAKSVLG